MKKMIKNEKNEKKMKKLKKKNENFSQKNNITT